MASVKSGIYWGAYELSAQNEREKNPVFPEAVSKTWSLQCRDLYRCSRHGLISGSRQIGDPVHPLDPVCGPGERCMHLTWSRSGDRQCSGIVPGSLTVLPGGYALSISTVRMRPLWWESSDSACLAGLQLSSKIL